MPDRKRQSGRTLGRVQSMTRSKNASAKEPGAVMDWAGERVQRVEHGPETTIFAQGDPANSVMYVEACLLYTSPSPRDS